MTSADFLHQNEGEDDAQFSARKALAEAMIRAAQATRDATHQWYLALTGQKGSDE